MRFASIRAEFLRVLQAGNQSLRTQYYRGSHDRPRKRPTACFVDTGDGPCKLKQL
jgi:hypothetical protein